jgi:hypothetical protein
MWGLDRWNRGRIGRLGLAQNGSVYSTFGGVPPPPPTSPQHEGRTCMALPFSDSFLGKLQSMSCSVAEFVVVIGAAPRNLSSVFLAAISRLAARCKPLHQELPHLHQKSLHLHQESLYLLQK